jgi:hypothetical protein
VAEEWKLTEEKSPEQPDVGHHARYFAGQEPAVSIERRLMDYAHVSRHGRPPFSSRGSLAASDRRSDALEMAMSIPVRFSDVCPPTSRFA